MDSDNTIKIKVVYCKPVVSIDEQKGTTGTTYTKKIDSTNPETRKVEIHSVP